VLPTLRELGIGFVAYSPLGRGFLTGSFRRPEDLEESDWRRTNPRFQRENFAHNLRLVEIVRGIAERRGATPAQVALAWLLRQGDDVVPIPGTRHVRFLEENAAAADLRIPEDSWASLAHGLASFRTAGERYTEQGMKAIDRTE
jgi:aryl-alcohol dehydrogenase-like predicted oxidoreductase